MVSEGFLSGFSFYMQNYVDIPGVGKQLSGRRVLLKGRGVRTVSHMSSFWETLVTKDNMSMLIHWPKRP